MDKLKSCDCSLCRRDQEVYQQLSALSPEAAGFWADIYSMLEHAEMDRDVNAAIIDGSWPDAAKLIRRARRRVKTKTPA